MAVSANQLQAMFARRREMEQVRTERSAAVNRYYDHWGKVTSRYESWTNPEYYEQADAQLRKNKEKKEKATKLADRREKLKKLFAEEQLVYDTQLQSLRRSKPRSRQLVDIETLEKIAQQAKEREDIKRKLDLEAKLYGRWRHGVNDDGLIYDSKSDHQVLAKLNWLDKKVDEQMQREKDEATAQERNLRLQEEKRKFEEVQAERQQLRAQEIKDVQTMQEQHMDALKVRHQESTTLRNEEKKLRAHVRELQKERLLLEESSAYIREPPEIAQAYNLKKIKILIRQRAETFRNQLRLTVNILERMQPYAIQREKLNEVLENLRKELDAEEHVLKQLDSMYESEAKYNLQRCEEVWQTNHLKRYNDVKRLVEDEQYLHNARLKENMDSQKEIIELRETHVEAIENSNTQLKKLMDEQGISENVATTEENVAVPKITASTAVAGGGSDIVVESLDHVNDGAGDRLAGSGASPRFFRNIKPSLADTVSENTLMNRLAGSTATPRFPRNVKPSSANTASDISLNRLAESSATPRFPRTVKPSSADTASDNISLNRLAGSSATPRFPRNVKPSSADTASDISLNRLAGSNGTPRSPRNVKRSSADTVSDDITVNKMAGINATPRFYGRVKPPSADSFSDNVAMNKATTSFQNLNLGAWQEQKGNDSLRLQTHRSMSVVTPDTAERPKFARKRVAWT